MPVVVGKSATSTTIFSGSLSHIVFSPYWNIPKSILVNEILPKVKRNPSYIDKHNMQVLIGNQVISAYSIPWNNYSDKVPLTVRQKPGPENALGHRLNFYFPMLITFTFTILLKKIYLKSTIELSVMVVSDCLIRRDSRDIFSGTALNTQTKS